MKRLACILTLFISVCVYGNTHILKNTDGFQYNVYSEHPEEYYYNTFCGIYNNGRTLIYLEQTENNKPILFMLFCQGGYQLSFVVTDIEKNTTPVPETSKTYCPGYLFEFRGNCSGFYASGNPKESGVCFFDEDPIIDCYEYGEWKKYDDFGEVIQNQRETENSVIVETLLNGRLNGTQVFMSKEPNHVQRINYYEMGVLTAQIVFDNDNQITKIAYEITPNDASSGGRYKCNFISYNTDGTKAKSCTMFFDAPLDGSEIQFP